MIVSESFKIYLCRASTWPHSLIRRFSKKYSSLSELMSSCLQSLFPREMSLARISVRRKKSIPQNGMPSCFSRKIPWNQTNFQYWFLKLRLNYWKKHKNQWWKWRGCLAHFLMTEGGDCRSLLTPWWNKQHPSLFPALKGQSHRRVGIWRYWVIDIIDKSLLNYWKETL